MAPRKSPGRRRAKGQSLPLIGLMIVVVVAMVGLSVDVGNTFSEERQAVSAANAASLSGMNSVIRRGPLDSNKIVYDNILASLRANGVQISDDGVVQGEQLRLEAYYIDAQGKPISDILPNGNTIPSNVAYLQVRLEGQVDTYFARVVGREDLPISASGYAGMCPAGDGVYPIAVKEELLTATGFDATGDRDGDTKLDDGYRVIQSGPYRGKTARFVYVHDGTNPSGNFGFLRWMRDTGQLGKSAKSAPELEASLSGFGNLSWGFQEAPQPEDANDRIDPYPRQAGQLNELDWVYGSEGWKGGGQSEAIADHIKLNTELTLPLYDRTAGGGAGDENGARFHITGFGKFVILAVHSNNAGGGGNDGKYFDMVYLGPATLQSTACTTTPVPPSDSECCELWGNVSVLPEYQIIPNDTQPIQYVIVLDQSGSMSANFKGQCDNKSPPAQNFVNEPARFWQCANGPLYQKPDGSLGYPPTSSKVTGTGTTYWWTNQNERRIGVAKKALETLIKLTNMPGNTGHNSAYPNDQMALIWFTDTVQRDGNNEVFANGTAFTDDRNDLITRMWARSTNGNPYLTAGGTNGAAGLYRAGRLLGSPNVPKEVVHTNGKTYKYKRVIIFITDGVSNNFFHESRTDLKVRASDSSTYPTGSDCKALGGQVVEDAECQTTGTGGIYTTTLTINGQSKQVGLDRPVSQAIDVSRNTLQRNGYAVFVLALSDLPATGLSSGIPSFEHYYKAVPNLIVNPDGSTNVDKVIKDINGVVESDRCQNGKDTVTTDKVLPTQYKPVLLPNNQTLDYPKVGYVTISGSNGIFTTDIVAGTDGKTTYHFSNVPPGSYQMTARLYYKHPLEPAGIDNRAYEDFWDPKAEKKVGIINVDVSADQQAGALIPATQQDIEMRLRGNPCEGAGIN